jgi:TolB-like protein/DNA-binding winged helix-turn-helix (wHTH) protein/tetratricopeptide (TPR) repeat protein
VEGRFRVGPWLVQPSLNTVSRNGTPMRLTLKAMGVLVCLAEHAGESVPKEKLLQTIWPETFVTDDVLKGSISELRRVLEDDAKEPRIIQTIPKRGYRLIAPIETANGAQRIHSADPSLGTLPITASNKRKLGRVPFAFLAAALLFLLLGAFDVGGVRTRLAGKSGAPQIHSLAVLPLQNLSADPAQEYFSDGMTDALITDLAQIGNVKVISRTSSMQYKQTKKSLPEIARELNVDGIIEGTVQRSGARVRITAQLIHGPSDKHLWASSYERDTRDIFALERDLTEEIAHQVQTRLSTVKPGPLPHPRPIDPKVLDAYVQGNYHLNGRGHGAGDEEPKKARIYFQQAIDADPNFAPAYIGLAGTHNVLSQGSSDDLPLMRKAAEKAVALEPTSSDAWSTLAETKWADWDWHGSEEGYRRALALNPNNATAHDCLASTLDVMGRLDEGWKEAEIAQELDPNRDHLADPLYQRGQFDRAIKIRQRIALRDPGDGYNHYALAMNYAQKGMYKEFVEQLQTSAALFGLPDAASRLKRAYDKSGSQGLLRQWAKELEHLAATKEGYFPGALAEAYATLGEKDRAFYWLEEYRQHHDLALADPTIYFKTDPWFAPIRSDPRFGDFLRRAGLPP